MVAKTNQTFQREFAKLNTAQRQAVETIEGPVMVIAGPGTGKTQVVAMRIAQILQKTQLDPRNILALTFTEAGVTTLRTRLETIIGSDAYQVGIFTFHSFASEIIGTFAYVFPQVSDNGQLSDLDRLQIIDRIVISDKSLINLRPSRQPSFHIPAIATAIQKLKQEAILPQLLVELSEVETKTALVSSKNTVQRELLTKRLVTNLELAKILGNYQDYLAKHQLYDFEDMILLATDALQNNHDVKGYYQERYQYLLVDEYQDTNNAQNALVEALADFFDTPNLFVVGDDKQAIYRFQGASVANMLHFTKKYPKIVTISLIDNYRNSQGLLNAASELINHNRHQLHECLPKIHSQLRSVSNNKARPIVVEAKSEEAQTAWLIEEIKKLQAKKVSLTDIAVLFRTNKEMAEFRTLAEKNGLDVSGNFSTNLLAEPEIRRLINLLRAVNQPTDDESLLTALPIIDGNINITHLAPVSWQGRRGQPLAGQFAKSAAKSLVKTAVEKILNLNRLASQQTLGELVESIVSGSDVLVALNSFPDRVERLEMIRAFIEEVGRFSQKHPQATLTGLL